MSLVNSSQLEVRLTKNQEEIFDAQKLRYKIFVEEFGARVSIENKNQTIERDKFDDYCDHLILIDKSAKSFEGKPVVVGTLRLLESGVAKKFFGFYSATEFNLTEILERDQSLLEIGRVCIDKNYRGHIAFHLLWLGLGEYVFKRNIAIIIGVASFHGTDPTPSSSALSLLSHKFSAPKNLNFKALISSSLDMNMMPLEELDQRKGMQQMPSLLKAYLRMGAKVGNGAFVDTKFNTIDIGIIIEVNLMDKKYKKLYGRLGSN